MRAALPVEALAVAEQAIFRVHRAEILPALSAVCEASDRGAKIPILSHVLLKPAGDQLRLRATDLDVEIAATCDLLSAESDFGFAISAADLLGIVKSLPEAAEIEFLHGRAEGQIILRTRSSRFTLLSLLEADFPSIVSFLKGDAFTIDVAPLMSAVGKVMFATDKADSGRPYTLGIYIAPERGGSQLLVAATNMRSLGAVRIRTQTEASFEPVLIPSKLAQTMRKIFSDEKASASLVISNNLMSVTCGGVSIFSRLIDGEFPVKIFDTVPKAAEFDVIATVDSLKSCVRRILLVAGDLMKEGIRLTLRRGSLQLELVNGHGESAVEQVPVAFDHDADFAIGLNAKMLGSLLDSVSTQDVRIGLTNAGNTVFRPTTDVDDTFAIAPMAARGVEA
ncbi:DNA polymerase III subunit beta [Neorhizobium alkalisoli]|uniref:Beta sliding clamp n=1 Tax=Neorhizobium alkalisoli TaxID=528178 RepID=A0A561QSD1_9HYPH|nr:DNA polymerase III subunit beta [Neorhizobium alkalisoli]TWF53237.1 DNA polymerase III beta subunit [Neorhizobium alkalisoli]